MYLRWWLSFGWRHQGQLSLRWRETLHLTKENTKLGHSQLILPSFHHCHDLSFSWKSSKHKGNLETPVIELYSFLFYSDTEKKCLSSTQSVCSLRKVQWKDGQYWYETIICRYHLQIHLHKLVECANVIPRRFLLVMNTQCECGRPTNRNTKHALHTAGDCGSSGSIHRPLLDLQNTDAPSMEPGLLMCGEVTQGGLCYVKELRGRV